MMQFIHRSVLFTQEPTRVLDAYKVVVQKDPENIRAIHSLATLEGNASTAAPEYVRQVFDELADTFEDKLVNHLEYKVPWQLIDEIKKHTSDLIHPVQRKQEDLPKKKTTVVLDLGCGTGLCGRLLAPYDTFLIGVRTYICTYLFDYCMVIGLFER
jgi:predicted TPR repeat methyltransferase